MVTLLPSPTLFLYTTLFRSRLNWFQDSARQLKAGIAGNDQGHDHADDHQPGDIRDDALNAGAGAPNCLVVPFPDLVDRKSTRLNSSHQIISYAVFCLKKKKY